MSLGSPPIPEPNDGSAISVLNDTFMEPLMDSLSSSQFDQEFNFEFSDHNYRYHDVGTPCSSLSPASSGPLQSPASYSVQPEPHMGSPSPPPTTQDFTEFLHASSVTRPFEADFSNLTLTGNYYPIRNKNQFKKIKILQIVNSVNYTRLQNAFKRHIVRIKAERSLKNKKKNVQLLRLYKIIIVVINRYLYYKRSCIIN